MSSKFPLKPLVLSMLPIIAIAAALSAAKIWLHLPVSLDQPSIVQHIGLDIMDDLHRLQRLAGEGSWASIRAAATYGAGIGVEQVLPDELVNPANAISIAEFELLARLRIHLLQALEEAVGNSGEDMDVLAERQVIQEAQQHGSMSPPEELSPPVKRLI